MDKDGEPDPGRRSNDLHVALDRQGAALTALLDHLDVARVRLDTVFQDLDRLAGRAATAQERMIRVVRLLDRFETADGPAFLDFVIDELRQELLDRPRSPYVDQYRRLLERAQDLRGDGRGRYPDA